MKRFVNGRLVEIPSPQGDYCNTDELRVVADIPPDRTLILQQPDGENRVLAQRDYFSFPEGFSLIDVPTHKRGRGQGALSHILLDHLRDLSHACPIEVADDGSFIIVRDVMLPQGYNCMMISILIEIPPDYPISPPGIGNYKIFLPKGLRYQGLILKDYHEHVLYKGSNKWCWVCYQNIQWDPNWDDLITLLEMIRADLNNPQTHFTRRPLWTI